MKVVNIFRTAILTSALAITLAVGAFAAPPVRVAIVPGSGSGMEQEMCDRIAGNLQGDSKVVVSTVNPDWFVNCTVVDRTDTAGGSVRVNGTVVIKTTDGQVIDTISTQTNKQDFSLQPGTPVNKRLADNAAREVINMLVDRVRDPLQNALTREIETRDKVIQAQALGDEDKFEQALALLMPITPDTPHFKGVRALIGELQMEQEAKELCDEAQKLGKSGSYGRAIELLKQVDPKSKRNAMAKALQKKYQAILASRRRRPATAKSPAPAAGSDAQLKALDAQKKALDAQKKAVEAQEAALRGKQK